MINHFRFILLILELIAWLLYNSFDGKIRWVMALTLVAPLIKEEPMEKFMVRQKINKHMEGNSSYEAFLSPDYVKASGEKG
jgi:hypothetical protein